MKAQSPWSLLNAIFVPCAPPLLLLLLWGVVFNVDLLLRGVVFPDITGLLPIGCTPMPLRRPTCCWLAILVVRKNLADSSYEVLRRYCSSPNCLSQCACVCWGTLNLGEFKWDGEEDSGRVGCDRRSL